MLELVSGLKGIREAEEGDEIEFIQGHHGGGENKEKKHNPRS
jgi:hypothetical protein